MTPQRMAVLRGLLDKSASRDPREDALALEDALAEALDEIDRLRKKLDLVYAHDSNLLDFLESVTYCAVANCGLIAPCPDHFPEHPANLAAEKPILRLGLDGHSHHPLVRCRAGCPRFAA